MLKHLALPFVLAVSMYQQPAMADALKDARIAFVKGQCEVAVGILQPLAANGDVEARNLLKDINDTTYDCQREYSVPNFDDGPSEPPVEGAPIPEKSSQ